MSAIPAYPQANYYPMEERGDSVSQSSGNSTLVRAQNHWHQLNSAFTSITQANQSLARRNTDLEQQLRTCQNRIATITSEKMALSSRVEVLTHLPIIASGYSTEELKQHIETISVPYNNLQAELLKRMKEQEQQVAVDTSAEGRGMCKIPGCPHTAELVTECGHLFCLGCFDAWAARCGGCANCPVCRKDNVKTFRCYI